MNIRNELSEFIRRVDGGNKLSPKQLGMEIEAFLGGFDGLDPGEVVNFVERHNAGKAMGAGHLADEIVDEFDLDEEGQ
jgi:hypothetical protein